MQKYELVRRSVLVDGLSKRKASGKFAVNRRTVDKMLAHAIPPGYQPKAPRAKPKLGPFLAIVEQIVAGDESAPKKQRHHAMRIYERLRDEHGYEGGPTQVRAYVSQLKGRRPKEAFVPLVSVPGEAEADFYEAVVEMDGVMRKTHNFLMTLPLSGVWFTVAYPAENAESFADGHVRAFEFFGGVPRRCVYDNPGYAVNSGGKPLKGRKRDLTRTFAELESTFLFEAEFAAPGKGNEKGSVESKVKTARSACFVPVPKVSSFEELNERLLAKAIAARDKAERFGEDAARFLPLADYKPCRLVQVKIDKLSLATFETCGYSVPCNLVGRSLLLRATPFELEILDGAEIVARHRRSLEKGRAYAQLWHYIEVLERKPRAARCALPVLQAGLPDEFEAYRRRVEDGTGDGDRRFVAVLKLARELGVQTIAKALGLGLLRGVVEPVDIRLLAMRDKEALPAVCTRSLRTGPSVERPPITEYTRLLAGGAL